VHIAVRVEVAVLDGGREAADPSAAAAAPYVQPAPPCPPHPLRLPHRYARRGGRYGGGVPRRRRRRRPIGRHRPAGGRHPQPTRLHQRPLHPRGHARRFL